MPFRVHQFGTPVPSLPFEPNALARQFAWAMSSARFALRNSLFSAPRASIERRPFESIVTIFHRENRGDRQRDGTRLG